MFIFHLLLMDLRVIYISIGPFTSISAELDINKVYNRMFYLQKDSTAVKEALDQLSEVGWAKQWSSQPYVSRRTVSLH